MGKTGVNPCSEKALDKLVLALGASPVADIKLFRMTDDSPGEV